MTAAALPRTALLRRAGLLMGGLVAIAALVRPAAPEASARAPRAESIRCEAPAWTRMPNPVRRHYDGLHAQLQFVRKRLRAVVPPAVHERVSAQLIREIVLLTELYAYRPRLIF